MKNSSHSIFISLVVVLTFFLSACGTAVAPTPEPFTFTPAEPQPLEDNPVMLLNEVPFELGLHKLDVSKPKMDEINSSDDVVNAIIGSAHQVADLQSTDLVNSVYLEIGDQPLTQSITEENGYIKAQIQKINVGDENNVEENNAEEFNDPGNVDNIWGSLYLNAIEEQTLGAGTLDDSLNFAMLVKYRIHGVTDGHSFGVSNSNIYMNMFEDNTGGLHFGSNDDQNHYGYSVENAGAEYLSILKQSEREWFYVFIAMDEDLGYRFITWQETDPANYAYYAVDLNGIQKPNEDQHGHRIWADIAFNSREDETSLDIESIKVYDFEKFVDTQGANRSGEKAALVYSDDRGKYELAVQLFEAGDYYNAYTLFNELEGYDTADYRAECERALQTIAIENPFVAGQIKKTMKDRGEPIDQYLYVYQAENLERLDLSKCRIDDLAFIRNFPNLKELVLDENGISDLTPLQDLTSLTSLSLGKNNISDVTPLQGLPDLQNLNLFDNLLEDVTALNSLTSLKELNLSTNNIYTIDDLTGLTNLEMLNLSYNFVYTISALENLPIKELNILNTDINDLYEVANFSDLETLYAGFRYIWKGNEGYLLTRKYEMDYNFFDGLTGLEALVGHDQLKKLYLARVVNEESLDPIATLTNLESLGFHQYAGASDPNVLGGLVNLKELALDSTGIGFYSTNFLANLTKLEKLYLGTFCYVEDLSVISGLTNLKELRMFKYGEDLSFLNGLKNLRLLQLIHWDTIEDFSPLLALDNLEYLSLEEMTVNDLSIISQLKELKFIEMNSPQINNIRDVGQLKNLECFILQNPQITGEYQTENFDVRLFAGLEHLKFVTMAAGAQQGYAYDLGDPEFQETIMEFLDTGIVYPQYANYWIENQEDAQRFKDYVGNHNLVVEGAFNTDGESIKLTIPPYVRNLYIFSYSDQPVRLELDGLDNKGLERLVIGHVEVSSDDKDGFGQGSFILENLDGLTGCTNLKEVYIDSTELDDYSALDGFEKLDTFVLNGRDLSRLYNQ